ncbi:ATP-binding cassette domain-containing protein [Vibrio sp. SS-MA-C1-2]|uniref:ATP-binding cassette domain-containing protein n=1 Tax=Vibrio sp. SS-MA-C1-2 TaxID=2908646 RepID=UPI002883399E|nr:ATP-binding cassette domain-containing protein [Vibrio sp. SS-MA-C1-2]
MTLKIKNFTINGAERALCQPINLTVKPGEVVTLMGASGCGKSTLLTAIAGHLSPYFTTQGEISLNDKSLLDISAEKRHIGILFQDDLLFPHLTIWQNLAFAIPSSIKGNERQQIALDHLAQLSLLEHANKLPDQLSGGQRARISLMRMLLSQPQAILLDEPFSKLDSSLRQVFRSFVFQHIKNSGIPTLMVTHDVQDIPESGYCLQWPALKPEKKKVSHVRSLEYQTHYITVNNGGKAIGSCWIFRKSDYNHWIYHRPFSSTRVSLPTIYPGSGSNYH